MIRAAALAGALLLVLAPASARSKLDPPDLDRYLRWGVLRVRPGVELSDLGYDDNIFASNEQNKVGDYTVTIAPRLDGLLLLGGAGFLTFRDQLEYTAYVNNGSQNFLNRRDSARWTIPLKRLGLFSHVSLENLKTRPIDFEDIRPEQRRNRFGAGIILEPGSRSAIEIGRSWSEIRYVDPDFDFVGRSIGDQLDRDTQGTTLQADYRMFGRTSLVLDALLQTIDFDKPATIDSREVPRDTREWRVLGGLEFALGGPLSGKCQVGWGEIDAEDPILPDFSDWVAEAELAYRFNSRMRVELEGKRLPGFSAIEGNAYYLRAEYGARVIHYVSRVLGFEGGASSGRLSFPESSSGTERRDRIQRYDLGVRMRLSENSMGRKVEYSLKIGRYRRNSSIDSADRSQNTVSLGALVGF